MKRSVINIILLISVNVVLNFWVIKLNHVVPLSNFYWGDSHFIPDQRIAGGNFDLLQAWAQTDSQWYLKIAAKGYGEPKNLDILHRAMDGLGYAFFPVYPFLIRIFAGLSGWNYLLGAYMLSNIIIILDWLSVRFVVEKIYSKKIASLTAWLIFLFPFSLFLRSYHAEGLYLLALTWWLYFLSIKKFYTSSLILGVLNVIKGTGWSLNVIFLFTLIATYKKGKISRLEVINYFTIAIAPIFFWLAYNYFATGDAFYFFKAVSMWKVSEVPPLAFNLLKLIYVVPEAISGHWISVAQGFVFFVMCYLLVASRKWLKPEWWWTSFLLLLIPTLSTYSSGHTSGRLAVVQLPLWIYLSSRLGKKWGLVVSILFTVLLFIGSLYFVNWYWWG